MSDRYVEGTFTGAGSSAVCTFPYPTEKSLKALSITMPGAGSVSVMRRVDGANWRTATDSVGNAYTFTATVETNIEVVPGAQYRLDCGGAAGGNIPYYFGAPRG